MRLRFFLRCTERNKEESDCCCHGQPLSRRFLINERLRLQISCCITLHFHCRNLEVAKRARTLSHIHQHTPPESRLHINKSGCWNVSWTWRPVPASLAHVTQKCARGDCACMRVWLCQTSWRCQPALQQMAGNRCWSKHGYSSLAASGTMRSRNVLKWLRTSGHQSRPVFHMCVYKYMDGVAVVSWHSESLYLYCLLSVHFCKATKKVSQLFYCPQRRHFSLLLLGNNRNYNDSNNTYTPTSSVQKAEQQWRLH